MGVHQVADIRNVALVGHSAAGKTSLGEAILYKAGLTNRLGSVEDGSSILDYDEEAKERHHSVESSAFCLEHNGKLINIIDTPGMPDYCGTAIASLAAVETAVVVVSASAGIGVNTRRMFNAAADYGLARMVVISRIDAEAANLDEVLAGVRETFGNACHPINLPAESGKRVVNVLQTEQGTADLLTVAECHTTLVEAIVETDDALMEEYMDSGSVPQEKLASAIARAVAGGNLIPVLFTNARDDVGIAELLDAILLYAPSPVVGRQRTLVVGAGEQAVERPVEPNPDDPFIAQVFKITSDPRSNIKYSVARVHGGSLSSDGQVFVAGQRKGQRTGHLLKLRGDQHVEIEAGVAGDIVAFAKLDTHIGDVLFADAAEGVIALPKFPTPMFALAIEPKARGDVEKISGALQRFSDEDPCFKYHRDMETNELVMQGLGDLHLTVVQSKMMRHFKVEVDTKPPKIPYHETISASAKYVEYTHKKQTGGAGQFARVFVDMEPNERGAGYEFIDKIFGGAIDQPFRPSVDKGVRDQMKKGVIAGYPVVDVKVYLVDGKTHPVDSKDIAFQIAGRQVFKKAFMQCKPILLEPIVNVEVTAPTDFVGEITRDLAGKRGQILGQDMLPGNQACIRAAVPLAEVATYSSQLKSVTGGQGSYMMELSHYDVVPPNVQQQIVAAHKPKGEED
jgi:elongation factor G